MENLRLLMLVLLLVLNGCASQAPISDSTWQQVNREILFSSRAAADQARTQAMADMQRWLLLVQNKTEQDYIPWFSGYWTQQWLGLKVAWYKLGSEKDEDSSTRRLARYLQEEYQEQVLEPVSRHIAPPRILHNATLTYLRHLDQHLPAIRERHQIPTQPFTQHLKQIPALAQPPGASLYQVLQSGALDRLPAYRELLKGMRANPDDWSAQPAMLELARHSSQQLAGDMAGSGSASLVGMAAGPAVGVPLSLGVAIFQANARSKRRPDTEARLRLALQQTLDAHWQWQLDDREQGVMAGVYHLSGQIEGRLHSQTGGLAPNQPRARSWSGIQPQGVHD